MPHTSNATRHAPLTSHSSERRSELRSVVAASWTGSQHRTVFPVRRPRA